MTSKIDMITKILSICAKQKGRVLDDFEMDLYVETIDRYSEDDLKKTVEFLRDCYKKAEFPSIQKIEDNVSSILDVKDKAMQISNQIENAIRQFGEPNYDSAKKALAGPAWGVVCEVGGWSSVCSVQSNRDLAIAKSTWRKTAEYVLKQKCVNRSKVEQFQRNERKIEGRPVLGDRMLLG